jgi:hypothetical protein
MPLVEGAPGRLVGNLFVDPRRRNGKPKFSLSVSDPGHRQQEQAVHWAPQPRPDGVGHPELTALTERRAPSHRHEPIVTTNPPGDPAGANVARLAT